MKKKPTNATLNVQGTNFNSLEFEGIKNEAGRNSFYLSAREVIRWKKPETGTKSALCRHQVGAQSGPSRGPS